MKKTSTAVLQQSRNLSQAKLTIGSGSGRSVSWYCMLDESGWEQTLGNSPQAMREVFGPEDGTLRVVNLEQTPTRSKFDAALPECPVPGWKSQIRIRVHSRDAGAIQIHRDETGCNGRNS